MRKLLIFMMLFILFIPLVSAQNMIYYPSKSAFNEFLNSTSSYIVVPGNSEWSISWAHYIDNKLSRFKKKGPDVIVLVGNVYDNPKMKELWHITNLSPKESLAPMVIVAGRYIFITGTRNNIYLTERAFSNIYNFTAREIWITILILVVIVFLFFHSFKDTSVRIFYLASVSLFIVWMLNSKPFNISMTILPIFERSTEFACFGGSASISAMILGTWFRLLSPTEEAIFILHGIVILLIISFLYYLAPRRYREYGFIIFGLIFASPTFRSYLEVLNKEPVSILIFIITLAIVLNFTFNPQKITAFCETLLLSFFTITLVYFIPWFLFLPVIFVIAFPKRLMRNYIYLILSAIGIAVMYVYSPFSLTLPEHLPYNNIIAVSKFLKESLIQLVLMFYLSVIFIKQGIKKSRGQLPFLSMLLVIYLYVSLWNISILPLNYVLMTTIPVRMLSKLTPQT
ncbi:hypothetical protein [Thermococcus sp.]